MKITLDIRRVLFTSMMGTFVVFALALTSACGAGFANNRSQTTHEVDDGINPVRRTTVTHTGSANAASVGLPMMGMAGYGVGGYGNPVVGGGNLCATHPDYCGTTVAVVNTGGSSIAGQPNPDLERRVANSEKQIGGLGKAYRAIIGEGRKTNARVTELEKKQAIVIEATGRSYRLDRVQCLHLQNNPDIIKDVDLSTKAKEACNEILGAASATEEGGNQ